MVGNSSAMGASLLVALSGAAGAQERPRARELGWIESAYESGPLGAITDVPGVLVGHATVREPSRHATGVTAILPHGGNLFQEKVRAGVFVGNGFGKLVGSTQVEELGQLETPILLTGTLSTFRAADALISHVLDQPGNEQVRSVNPVVGETNDGWLSDIRSRPIAAEHVEEALRSARGGPVQEGSVGAGTGTVCFGYKGGIGTASRRVPWNGSSFTVGVLVQTNFGGRLRIRGVEIPGPSRGRPDGDSKAPREEASRDDAASDRDPREKGPAPDGSCMIVLATDVPLDARQLGRLARRGVFGMARAGAAYSHGSGDYCIAFSTLRAESDDRIEDAALSPLFEATLEAVEEAILNSLCQATTTVGFQGRRCEALDTGEVARLLSRDG